MTSMSSAGSVKQIKTFTDWHPGLVRFPMLSIWSLQPYGAAVPSCSSRFQRKGVLKIGLFVQWYIFWGIRTFIERTEWYGRLKCLYNNWLPPVLHWTHSSFFFSTLVWCPLHISKELSVIRILHVLQFLVPHLEIVQSFGTNLWSLRADPSHSVLGYISFKFEILH